ncbi:MAG: putative PEP-binding protein [Acidimicrobiales bacterium]
MTGDAPSTNHRTESAGSEAAGERVVAAVHAAAAAGTAAAVADSLAVVTADEIAGFYHAQLDLQPGTEAVAQGVAASPGAASGRIALTSAAALAAADRGENVILVRPETTPDDVLGMQASAAILTARGGLASHAAVVARGWGIPAVVGVEELTIVGDQLVLGGQALSAGDELTVDGSTGAVYLGRLATSTTTVPPELDTLLAWADTVADGHVTVRVNADNGPDATQGRALGAQGIGLCRTEHMFLAPDRLPIMRRFILAADAAAEDAALAELEKAQTADFEQILAAMDGLPVTVRLLDPPLHEFLPDLVDLTARQARGELDADGEAELAAVRRLHETNPMIGTRGVRLGFVRPGVYQMQVRALCRAAAGLLEQGRSPRVEMMIPLVAMTKELVLACRFVHEVLDEINHPDLSSTALTIGVMIETPRAALVAGALAGHADFFSFGTNDLTQLTYGFSRDDVEARLLPTYAAHGVLSANPFAELDPSGVGALVEMACVAARATRPTIKLGVCGEHAGHPASIRFLVDAGVDSVSCSPYRVPVARLAVAQALLAGGRARVDGLSFAFDGVNGSAGAGVGTGADGPAGDGTSDVANGTGGPAPVPEVGEVTEAMVLHVLRIRGFVSGDGLVESLGVMPTEVVAALVDGGYLQHMEARNLYSLTPSGRERQEALLADYGDQATTTGLGAPYQQFLELNDAFKQLCTDWQIRDGEPNDHTDPAYDEACSARLAGLFEDSRRVLTDMAGVVPRFARYQERLGRAATDVAGGDTRKFTGVMCESFHDIWMELHEDLIVLQGIDRTAEGSF